MRRNPKAARSMERSGAGTGSSAEELSFVLFDGPEAVPGAATFCAQPNPLDANHRQKLKAAQDVQRDTFTSYRLSAEPNSLKKEPQSHEPDGIVAPLVELSATAFLIPSYVKRDAHIVFLKIVPQRHRYDFRASVANLH